MRWLSIYFKNFSNFTTLLVGLLGLITLILLVQDLMRPQVQTVANTFGVVEHLKGDAIYRPAGTFQSLTIKNGISLGEGDIVITTQGSELTIISTSGKEFKIPSNSSVLLSEDSIRQASVSDQKNFIHANFNEATDDQNIDPRLKLLSPADKTEVFYEETMFPSIDLSWSAPKEYDSSTTYLQLSTDPYFENLDIQDQPITQLHDSHFQAPIKFGKFYWRLYEKKSDKNSIPRTFEVRAIAKLIPEAPKGPVPTWGHSADFQWTTPHPEVVDIGNHWIEISQSQDFHDITFKQLIAPRSNHSLLQDLPEGTYFWRIHSQYPGHDLKSQSIMITLQNTQEIKLWTVSPKDFQIFEPAEQIHLEWKSNKPKSNYKVQIANMKGTFSREIDTPLSASNIGTLPPGNYEWSVSTKGEITNGVSNRGRFAVLGTAGITLTKPADNGRVEIGDTQSEIEFDWKDTKSGLHKYKIQIAEDPHFIKQIIEFDAMKAPITQNGINLAAGNKYFWRVISIDKEMWPVNRSTINSFVPFVLAKIARPENLLPTDQSTCNPIKNRNSCHLRWSAVSGASSYEIRIYLMSEQSKKMVINEETKTNEFEIDHLAEGSYMWQVQAFDRNRRRGEASVSMHLNYKIGKPPSAPRSLSSEVQ